MKDHPHEPLGSSLRIQATVCGGDVGDGAKTSSHLVQIQIGSIFSFLVEQVL